MAFEILAAVTLGGWLVNATLATAGVAFYARSLRPLRQPSEQASVLVLSPVKGPLDDGRGFVDRLLDQAYSPYRVVFIVEDESDPAFHFLNQKAATSNGRAKVIAAGPTRGCGQKNWNLIAGLAQTDDTDSIIVTIDADTLVPPTWLATLIRPLLTGRASVSTGYRWLLPVDDALPSQLAAVVDIGIATAGRSHQWVLCWGGSTAFRHEIMNTIDVASHWGRTGTDDIVLTRALNAAGIRTHAPTRALVPSPVSHTWPSLIRFGRRQYQLLRAYAPRHWFLAGWVLLCPLLATGIGGLAGWFMLTGLMLATAIILYQIRITIRRRIAIQVLPQDHHTNALETLRRARWLAPLAWAVHSAAFLSSAMDRLIRWSGRHYQLDPKGNVTKVTRVAP